MYTYNNIIWSISLANTLPFPLLFLPPAHLQHIFIKLTPHHSYCSKHKTNQAPDVRSLYFSRIIDAHIKQIAHFQRKKKNKMKLISYAWVGGTVGYWVIRPAILLRDWSRKAECEPEAVWGWPWGRSTFEVLSVQQGQAGHWTWRKGSCCAVTFLLMQCPA